MQTTISFFFSMAALAIAYAATFTFTSSADTGAGSLRQVIEDANTAAGTDIIEFATCTGQQTFTLATALPTIVETLTINQNY